MGGNPATFLEPFPMTEFSPLPRYPGYVEKRQRERVLAYLGRDNNLVLENGVTVPISSWEDFKQAQIENRLDVYLVSMPKFPWWQEVGEDPGATIVPGDGNVLAIEIRDSSRHKFVTKSIAGWLGQKCNPDSLARLRALMDLVGVGTHGSPAALSQALYRRMRNPKDPGPRIPPERLRQLLFEHGTGGRADLLAGKDEVFDEAFEYDMANAYLSTMRWLPSGDPVKWTESVGELCNGDQLGPDANMMATFFCRCVVNIPERAQGMGPFPLRDEQTGNLVYPTEVGWYGLEQELWLWKDQIERCLEAGMFVWTTGEEAWGYQDWSDRCRRWANKLEKLRDQAAPDLKPLVKMLIVAGIGWHGQKSESCKVVPLEEAQEVVSTGDGPGSLMFGVSRTAKPNKPYMTHWYYWSIMRVGCAVWDFAQAEMRAGNRVLMTNYDAVLLMERHRTSVRFLPKRRVVGLNGHKGNRISWHETELHDVTIPASRSIVCREKIRLPGVSRVA